jgi:hypothetical protein
MDDDGNISSRLTIYKADGAGSAIPGPDIDLTELAIPYGAGKTAQAPMERRIAC